MGSGSRKNILTNPFTQEVTMQEKNKYKRANTQNLTWFDPINLHPRLPQGVPKSFTIHNFCMVKVTNHSYNDHSHSWNIPKPKCRTPYL